MHTFRLTEPNTGAQRAAPAALFARFERLRRQPARPLPDRLRTPLEARVGIDLSRVRVFDCAESRALAADLDAAAVAVGRDIVLADRLEATRFDILAHEIVHCLQQGFVAGPLLVGIDPDCRCEAEAEHIAVHGMRAQINPVIGFRNVGWTMVFIYAASMATVYIAGSMMMAGSLAAGVGAAGAVGTGAAGGTGGGTVVSLAAFRAARAASDARVLAAAAGVLFTVTSVSIEANASTPVAHALNSTAVRAVAADLFPNDNYVLGASVTFDGTSYRIIGRAQTP